MGGGSTLISGSKDKNLRCYNLKSDGFEQIDAVMNAHNDQITALETNKQQNWLYSASRDSTV